MINLGGKSMLSKKSKGILLSVITVSVIVSMLGTATMSYLSDTETSFSNTIAAGIIDLKIDCKSTHSYDGNVQQTITIEEKDLVFGDTFFNWQDVKPGDNGEATLSFHVYDNDAWLWFQACNVIASGGAHPEPEQHIDPNNECDLDENINVRIWWDDGDNTYEPEESETLLWPTTGDWGTAAEALQWLTAGALGPYEMTACTTYYIGIEWNIPTNVGNEIQGDSLTFDLSFYAEQTRNNPNPIGPGSLCDESLVGYWAFDDESGNTAMDSSGHENHGTLMPHSPVWTSEGISSGALAFDGVDDFVEIPDAPSLDITDEITLMAWVYPENWDEDAWPVPDKTTENAIITKAGDAEWGVWNLHYKTTSNGFRFEISLDGTSINIFETTPSTELHTWYHIAGVYDGSEIKLYVNGELSNSIAATGSIDTNNQPVRIGKQFWFNNGYDIYSLWDGKMDEVKIYNRSLSADEIFDEYCCNNPLNTILINDPGPQYSASQYGYDFDYGSANVAFTYNKCDTTLKGTIQASGLKPYCTYQVKLLGIPTCQDPFGDDMANEYLGYKGRWTCLDCGCSGAGCNRNDAEYLAHSYFRGDGSECIAGYLVFDFFTADEHGYASKNIVAETSYHVLFAGGGVCDTNNNDFLAYLDAAHPTVKFCPPEKVNGQPEPGRGGCNGLSFDADSYHCKIELTEESFHCGNWATVLQGTIDFIIQ